MGLRSLAKKVIQARDEFDKVRFIPCRCPGFTLQREGCQCGVRKATLDAKAALDAAVYNLKEG